MRPGMLSLASSWPFGLEPHAGPAADGAAKLMQENAEYRLTLANDLDELRRMSEWLEQSCHALGLTPARASEFDLCANEAVTNIISYGYEAPGRREILLRLARLPAGASLTIEDDGRPFNPLEAQLPARPANLAAAGIGGLGIKLIRGMMAECAYQHLDGKNILTLIAHA
jgi:anti-sigma regulatory factor (Ser/Thr protein kinase)